MTYMEKQVEDGTTRLNQLLVSQELTSEHKAAQTRVSSCIMSVKNEQFVEKSKTHSRVIKERTAIHLRRY